MELFCPPTTILPDTIDATLIHVCKSKAYNGEAFLMPRIGAAKVKKHLQKEFGVSNELFEQMYKGKGVCLRYYPITETFLIRIAQGKIFRLDAENEVEIEDVLLLDKICAFHKVASTAELKDAKLMRFFLLSEAKKFETPKRTKNKNNSYSTDFLFAELEGETLPMGEEKNRS